MYHILMVVILDSIRSTYNVGSIFRTADAAGVEKIYLCGITPQPIDRFGRLRPQFTKVSLGAEKTVLWERVKSASALIDRLKKEKYHIIAVEQDRRAVAYTKFRAPKKTAVIFGNEVSGISNPILKKADKIIEIPMRGKKESLNVSVAAGIIMFSILYS